MFSLVSGAHKDKAQLYPVELLPAEIQEKFKYRGGRIPLLAVFSTVPSEIPQDGTGRRIAVRPRVGRKRCRLFEVGR